MSLKLEAKNTIKLALPLIFGELAQMLLHITDTAMIGATGPNSYKQVAAAALAFSVVTIPFLFGIGITMSVSQMTSMAKGKEDYKAISHHFYNGFWLCAIAAILISLGIELSQDVLFHLGQDDEIARLALPFLRVMGISIIPMLMFMTLKQFTDGLEFTRTAMVLSFLSLPINMFINWLLIFGNLGFPRLEMMGAAYGTLITRSLIFIVLAYIIWTHRIYKPYIQHRASHWKIHWPTMKELLHIGVPSAMQFGMEGGVFAVSAIIVGTFGAEQLAAHQIALQCASFTFMASMGLSQAASIRVSNAYGQGNWSKIFNIGKSTLLMSLAYGVFCALLFFIFRAELPLIFLDDDKGLGGNALVIQLASSLLLLAGLFQISDATQVISVGILRGIKDVRMPTVFIFIAYWVLGLPIGYWMAKHFELKASGIWLGFIIGLTFVSISLTIRFFNKIKRELNSKTHI